MVAKKMFPTGEVDRALSKAYDHVKLKISFRILAEQRSFAPFFPIVEKIRR
jgi:hypothetical protein